MGTVVKMYIHVLFVDIHKLPLFRKCESDFINKTIKCSNALPISDIIRPSTCTCNPEEQKQLVLFKQVKVAIYTFMGYRQTVEIQIRFRRMWCLIRKPWNICYTKEV